MASNPHPPAPQGAPRIMTPAEAAQERAREAAREAAEAKPTTEIDVPGGRYLVNGVLVDANGEPVKDKS